MEKPVKFAFVLFASSLLIGIVAGYVLLSYEVGPPEKYTHSYEVSIKSNSTTAFTILCPIPLDKNNEPYPNFLDEVQVTEGNATTMLIGTESGNSSTADTYLAVIGTGDVRIEWGASWSVKSGNMYLNLSGFVANESIDLYYYYGEVNFWVYSSVVIEAFKFSYSATVINDTITWISTGGPIYHTDYQRDPRLSIGFQQVSMNYCWMLGN